MPNKKQKIENCIGNGLYCARPGKAGVTDRKNIISESLRQKCIYSNVTQNKKNKNLFWDYIEKFYGKYIYERKFDKSCSEKIMKKFGISEKEIKKF